MVEMVAVGHGGRAAAANRRGGGADVWIEIPAGQSAGAAFTAVSTPSSTSADHQPLIQANAHISLRRGANRPTRD
jgi:hypothetical protein